MASHSFASVVGGPLLGSPAYELVKSLSIASFVLAAVPALRWGLRRQEIVVAQWNEELREHVRELTALHGLTRAGTDAVAEADVIERGLEAIMRMTNCDVGVLWLGTGEGTYDAVENRGISDQAATLIASQPAEGDGLVARAVGAAAPIVLSDLTDCGGAGFERLVDLDPGLCGATAAVAPLIIQGTPLGALMVLDRNAGTPSEQQIRSLETAALELGMALGHRRMIAEVQKQGAGGPLRGGHPYFGYRGALRRRGVRRAPAGHRP